MLGGLARGALQHARVSGEAGVSALRLPRINVAQQRSLSTVSQTCGAGTRNTSRQWSSGVLQTVTITQQRRAMAASAGGSSGVSEWESVADNLAAVNAKIAATVARLPDRKVKDSPLNILIFLSF